MPNPLIDAPLKWQEVAAVGAGAPLGLSQAALGRIGHAKAIVAVIVARHLRVYGVNTGVGALSEVLVDESRQSALSRNIVMSHACGVGDPLPVRETRAIMTAAVNNFAHGHSGVRAIVVQRLVDLLNADLIPVVPRGGSIGYLTHMAHICLVLLGEGFAHAGGSVICGKEALAQLGVAALTLEAKEGLSLVNGTPCSTGLACVALQRLQTLLEWADVVGAMTFENIGSQPGAFAMNALAFRISSGIAMVGSRLTKLLAGSEILAGVLPQTQDAMSLRAIPQVHGAARECFESSCASVNRELASVTDNPIICGTLEEPVGYSQAHPIGTGFALTMDSLAIAAAKIAATSERRIDRLVNPLVSRLPAFLARQPGISSGFMIAQYTALALASENRRLASPSSLDGGVSSALQEDEIPHATAGALRVLHIIDNFERILAIELLAAAQAYEFQNPALRRAPATDGVYRELRVCVPAYDDDRPLSADIATAISFLRRAAPP
jgi:histidine ammonia-lyase